MTMTANGLAKLLEELGELAQITAKKLAFMDTDEHPDGKGSMRVRMQEEMGDVRAAIDFVTETFGLDSLTISRRANVKLTMFRYWHAEGTHPTCNICRRPLNQPFKRDTIDCGGDCVRCMALSDDPDCLETMREVEPDNPRWADHDADSSPDAPPPVAD